MAKAIVRCKLRVFEVLDRKDANGSTTTQIVKLQAVYSNDENDENKQWSKWTPQANFEIHITNPGAMGKLSSGHEFYVDFIPVEKSKG